jgi:hypothetical protein
MHDAGAYEVFALRVSGVAMDRVYPTGTTVFCVPIQDFEAELESGDRVVCFLRGRDGTDRNELRELNIRLNISETGRA